jgi:O-antigen/teichoic acid export membrane protein
VSDVPGVGDVPGASSVPPVRSAGRDTIRTLLFNGVATLFGVVTGIIVAKALGPVGKGEFSGLSLLQNGIGSVTGGIGASITYHLTKEKRSLSDLVWPLLAIFAALSVGLPALLALWGLRFGFDPVVVVFAATAPATLIIAWQQGVYLGLNRVRSLNAQVLGFSIFMLIAVSAALAAHFGVRGAMWAWSVCTYGAAIVVVVRAAAALRGSGRWKFAEAMRSIFDYGVRSGVYGLLGFLNYRIDSLVLIAFLGAQGFGVYSVAVSAGELLFRVPRAVATATTYRIGAATFDESAATTAKAIRTSTAVVAACALPLFLLAPWLIGLLYGSRFADAAPALRILLPGIVLFVSAGLFSPFFAFQMGRPIIVVYISLLMIAVQTGTGVWLVPILKLQGAAIASTATYLTSAVFVTWYYCRLTKLRWVDVWILRREDLTSLRRLLPRAGSSDRPSSDR